MDYSTEKPHWNSVVNCFQDERGDVIELKVECVPTSDCEKPKGFIQWVSNALVCEVRLYDRLFKHENPEDTKQVPGGFITDCNQVSHHTGWHPKKTNHLY